MEFWNKNRRIVLCFSVMFCVCLAISAAFADAMTVAAGSWGLRFQEEGEPPVGNTSPSALADYDAAFLQQTQEQVLYLTFDAGYENGCTGQILDVLKAHQAPATFFLVGSYLEQHPDLVQRMADEGHTVGNHTWSHPDMSRLTDEREFSEQLGKVEAAYEEITGEAMKKFYRPPQGLYSQENLTMAKNLGYKTVFWSLAHVDWEQDNQPDPQEALKKLLSRTHPGAVVLLHSTSQTNTAILDKLLTAWEQLGYEIRPIEELFP